MNVLYQNLAKYRSGQIDYPTYSEAQYASLELMVRDGDPFIFELHSGTPGVWEYPYRFVVDPTLLGTGAKFDSDVPELFQRLVLELRTGRINVDDLGRALRGLARKSTPVQFEWYRRVLEKRVDLPCSPVLLNRVYERDDRFPVPRLLSIKPLSGQIAFPRGPVIVEELIEHPRRIIMPGRRAFDQNLEPDLDFSDRNNFIRGIPEAARIDLYVQEKMHSQLLTLRDFWSTPESALPGRIDDTIALASFLGLAVVGRVQTDPEHLRQEIDLIRERGYSGFNILTSSADTYSVRFDQTPSIEFATDTIRIRIVRDALHV